MSVNLKLAKMLVPENFYQDIDICVKKYNMSYIDAIVECCSKNNIEIEVAAAMLKNNSKVKSQIQQEGEDLNFLPRSAKLPI